MQEDRLLEMSVELAKAHLASTPVPTREVAALVRSLFEALKEMRDLGQSLEHGGSAEAQAPDLSGADGPNSLNKFEPPILNRDVSGSEFAGIDPWLAARVPKRVARLLNRNSEIHPSVHDDHLICLEDGQKVKLLRSYLLKKHGMTLTDYIDRWSLPQEYPTAPATYVERKRALAKVTGLGITLRGSRGPAKTKGVSESRKADVAKPTVDEDSRA